MPSITPSHLRRYGSKCRMTRREEVNHPLMLGLESSRSRGLVRETKWRRGDEMRLLREPFLSCAWRSGG